jgi:hypothetical protein
MTTIKLPPLPEPDYMYPSKNGPDIPGFDDETLEAYATQAVEAALAERQGEALPYEKFVAIREGHFNAASEEYFSARPQLDTKENRRIFYAGHCKGYDAKPAPAPAQQPLSDDEIAPACAKVKFVHPDAMTTRDIARAIERAHGIGGEK